MKNIKWIAGFGLLLFAQQGTLNAQELKNNQDTVSYALGIDVGKSLSSSGIAIESSSFLKGLEASLKGGESLLGEEERMRILRDAFNTAAEQRTAKLKSEETTFFEKIKQNPNIKHFQGGLYYEVIREGTGEKPTANDEVDVHYLGTLANGKEFDSSYKRGQSTQLDLNRVIKGWQMGIPLMSVGSKYKFYIPSELGYGERGAGANIPPYSALVFEIELLGINKTGGETSGNMPADEPIKMQKIQ